MAEPRGDSRTLQDYVSVLRRRKWVILLALIVVPAVAVVFSLRQSPLYASSAQVLMSNQDLAGALTNTQSWQFNLTSPFNSGSSTLTAKFQTAGTKTLMVNGGGGVYQYVVTTGKNDKLLSASATNGKTNSVLTVSHCSLSGAAPTAQVISWTGSGTSGGSCSSVTGFGSTQTWKLKLTSPFNSGSSTLTANFQTAGAKTVTVAGGGSFYEYLVTTGKNDKLLSASATNGKAGSVLSVVNCALSGGDNVSWSGSGTSGGFCSTVSGSGSTQTWKFKLTSPVSGTSSTLTASFQTAGTLTAASTTTSGYNLYYVTTGKNDKLLSATATNGTASSQLSVWHCTPSGSTTPTAKVVNWTGNGTNGGYCSTVSGSGNTQTWQFNLTSPFSSGSSTLTASFQTAGAKTVSVSGSTGVVKYFVTTGKNDKLLSASSTNGSANSVLTISHCTLSNTPGGGGSSSDDDSSSDDHSSGGAGGNQYGSKVPICKKISHGKYVLTLVPASAVPGYVSSGALYPVPATGCPGGDSGSDDDSSYDHGSDDDSKDKQSCNSGRGNKSEGNSSQLITPSTGNKGTSPTVDCDPGNSGSKNKGGD